MSNKCDMGITYKLTEIIVWYKIDFLYYFFYPTQSALYYSIEGRGVL